MIIDFQAYSNTERRSLVRSRLERWTMPRDLTLSKDRMGFHTIRCRLPWQVMSSDTAYQGRLCPAAQSTTAGHVQRHSLPRQVMSSSTVYVQRQVMSSGAVYQVRSCLAAKPTTAGHVQRRSLHGRSCPAAQSTKPGHVQFHW